MPEATLPVYSEAAAREAHCWFTVDRVAGDPASTAWKRQARWRQSTWRHMKGLPMGHAPYRGGPKAVPVGSRLELAFARSSGGNFLSDDVRETVMRRLAHPEPYQMLAEDRLWADLLSSMPLCFNLFGQLEGERASRAVRQWWPDAPTGDVSVRFEHSPGRRDWTYLGNQSAFDVAFDIDAGAGMHGIVGVETKYHEHAKVEAKPGARAMARYVEITERSGIFAEGWRDAIEGTALQQIWLDHLLVLAMLQHPSGKWKWGRFVLVCPTGNPSFAAAAESYRQVLRDPTTFEVRTIEAMVVGRESEARVAFEERYIDMARAE